jgi:hypothetical protein
LQGFFTWEHGVDSDDDHIPTIGFNEIPEKIRQASGEIHPFCPTPDASQEPSIVSSSIVGNPEGHDKQEKIFGFGVTLP